MLTSTRAHVRAQIEFGVRLSLLGGLALIVLGNDGTQLAVIVVCAAASVRAHAALYRGAGGVGALLKRPARLCAPHERAPGLLRHVSNCLLLAC